MLEPVDEKLHVRSTLLWAFGFGLALVSFGLVSRRPSGLVFGLCALYLVALLIKRAFSWSPDPHAKRKFLFFAVASLAGGGLGTVLIDTLTVELLVRLGQCPINVRCL